ncbi:MAG: D-alanyl-D-alanine carboxypeptidase [Alicyclobacillaceae bacterium]|nr:D-alanyl-D-alanine carboxypeptidase [Alicyclobacillaceae bacterium]
MRTRWIVLLIVIIVIAIPVIQFVRPIPKLKAESVLAPTATVPGPKPVIHWPAQGEAALAAVGIGNIGHYGSNTPLPIASVTKLMTAYLTLKKHPLGVGEPGPTFTITPHDVAVYEKDVSLGESVVKVAVGEKITERQVLEGLLLPSGNNLANLLAHWDAGSQAAFVREMNAEAVKLGMKHTHYVDASGYNPGSASTAVDLLKLFAKVVKIRTFRDITSKAQATVPVAGTIYNVNWKIGQGGIIAGKTGSTTQAGGCFVFASEKHIDGKKIYLIGAVLGQEGISPITTALDEGISLSEQAQGILRNVKVLSSGVPAVKVSAPWQSTPLTVDTPKSVDMIGWPGLQVQRTVKLEKISGSRLANGTEVGTLTVQLGDQKKTLPLVSSAKIPGPTYLWRLKRV